jgi:hypothetical protein
MKHLSENSQEVKERKILERLAKDKEKILKNDNRVFAYEIKKAMKGKKIVISPPQQIEKKKTYELECGKIQGFFEAIDIKTAFKKAMKLNEWTKKDWGILLRFREVILNSTFEVIKKGKWYYQDPKSL